MALRVTAARRARDGEQVCGDATCCWVRGDGWRLGVADGLGHGPGAAEASDAALAYVGEHLEQRLPELMAGCDVALRATRGVALAVADISADGRLSYAAVGNPRGRVLGRKNTSLGADPGIIGAGFARLMPETLALQDGDLLAIFTDGLPRDLPLAGVRLDDVEAVVGRLRLVNDDAALMLARWTTA